MRHWTSLTFALLIFTLLAAQVAADPPDLDLSQTTAPEGEPLAGLRICVDAGHGGQTWRSTRGYTGGTRSAVSETTESDVNLRVALLLWDMLTQAGAEVVMTRTEETRLSADCPAPLGSDAWKANRREELAIRRSVAEANDCDALVAIHHNAVGNPEVNFTTAFFFDPALHDESLDVEHPPEAIEAARALAQRIVERVSARLELSARSARHGNYHVLRESSLPAVIVEASFMTHPDEARRLDDLAHNRLEAIGIFEAIVEWHTAQGGMN